MVDTTHTREGEDKAEVQAEEDFLRAAVAGTQDAASTTVTHGAAGAAAILAMTALDNTTTHDPGVRAR